MQSSKGKAAEGTGRKAKLAQSYQSLLDEFSTKDLKSVGNYTLGRLVGKGSFGKVYLATHKLTNGSKVVLKSANKGDSNLAREIHHHRQFVHPHIARLYEVIVTENLVWLVLEYCSGDELYNYLLEQGPLPVPKVQKIFAQLVGAVYYVHQQSCVHRDLKLENIIFDKHENVKLIDFGFTREYEGRMNHLQTFCGTICYSAPEMLKGEKYAGEKVDVWSLGIILYALLCGELPFDDDDDNVTRTKILTDDPKFPDHLPTEAVSLIKLLLSKRPFPRPSLPDMLAHPFLAEHAPAQQAILDVKQTPPFATALEKDCLERMRSAGVNIDLIIESVLAEKCDALSGWWTLLLEKEERKMVRREKKRKEREAENKSLRRLSAASSRLERMAPTLQDVEEEGGSSKRHSLPRTRGRSERRSAHYYTDMAVPDLPQLPEVGKETGPSSPEEVPPTPVDKDSVRSVSTSRQRRPIPPPKEGIIRGARSRGSTLHLVTTTEALAGHNGKGASQQPEDGQRKAKKKPSQTIIAHWKNWTHWFIENTTRRRQKHDRRKSRSTPDLHKQEMGGSDRSKEVSSRPQTSKYPNSASPVDQRSMAAPKKGASNGHVVVGGASGHGAGTRKAGSSMLHSVPHRIATNAYKRQSLSPSPLTPRSALRRPSAGLRGRKSTSSSVSSVRSMHHHHHSHSKASSTSSIASATSKTPMGRGQSPHHSSVKMLPATPATATSFPSNIRLVRVAPAPLNLYDEDASHESQQPPPGSPNPFASGVLFAKRKKNIFKGPTLNFGSGGPSHRSGGAQGSHSRSGSGSGLGRRSGEITIQEEEDEDHSATKLTVAEEDEDIEEVDAFSPILGFPGERIEEQIFEEDEDQSTPTATEGPKTPATATKIADDGLKEETTPKAEKPPA